MVIEALLLIFVFGLHWGISFQDGDDHLYPKPSHHLSEELLLELSHSYHNFSYCEKRSGIVSSLAARVANDYSVLHLHDDIRTILVKALTRLDSDCTTHSRIAYILSVMSFSQGAVGEAEKYYALLNPTDLVFQRAQAAQVMIGKDETQGIALMVKYTSQLSRRFVMLFHEETNDAGVVAKKKKKSTRTIHTDVVEDNDVSSSTSSLPPTVVRSPSNEESEDMLLSLLMTEAQGAIRSTSKLADLVLSTTDIRPLDARQRFRLGVGLAKLGLFELSLRHVSLSATPWEAPLYRLRAKLVFPPVHSSVRAVALAVGNFERQGESIISIKEPSSPLMVPICNSLSELSLALQALPLLHLAGFASPREQVVMGHSPVSLPVLLSEVLMSMCPPKDTPLVLQAYAASNRKEMTALSNTNHNNDTTTTTNDKDDITTSTTTPPSTTKEFKKIHVGVVSGSFDGIAGRIIVSLLESIEPTRRASLILTVMCFPTPRDGMTDRAGALFDHHLNISPTDKSEAIDRILHAAPDFILFSDAAYDSRVFALAHERLAPYQAALWGWGGTVAIPTLDFFFAPALLWQGRSCALQGRGSRELGGLGDHLQLDHDMSGSGSGDTGTTAIPTVLPQELFTEQVVLLDGTPTFPTSSVMDTTELWRYLQNMFLFPPANRTHVYVFPGTVRHLHPEFDAALSLLLRTDPVAVVVLAVPKVGRDHVPTTHLAVRHDLMHPAAPAAAVAKLKARLRVSMGASAGTDMLERIRVLPPLDERAYRALLRICVAVLDPFPVGMHLPLLEAMLDDVPIVSAPALQECTNSHAIGLSIAMGIGDEEGVGLMPVVNSKTGGARSGYGSTGHMDQEHLISAHEWDDEEMYMDRSHHQQKQPPLVDISKNVDTLDLGQEEVPLSNETDQNSGSMEGDVSTAGPGQRTDKGGNIHPGQGKYAWPSTAEEYAVFALRLQMEHDLRAAFVRPKQPATTSDDDHNIIQVDRMDRSSGRLKEMPRHGDQVYDFIRRLVQTFP